MATSDQTQSLAKFTAVRCDYSPQTYVGHVQLNRPTKSNAMSRDMWEQIPLAVETLTTQGARAIVLSGAGPNFCGGIDVSALNNQLQDATAIAQQPARYRHRFISFVKELQDSMTSLERCPVPIIAAIHGACIGAGIDLITAADIRYATFEARFSVKEVDIAITSDMGTLARLPGIIGDGRARDIALTAREFSGAEAKEMGLVTGELYRDQAAVVAAAMKTAESIAGKAPLAVMGTKQMLLYQRDHTVDDGLNMVAVLNAAVLPGSEEVKEVFAAKAGRRKPVFVSKL